MIPDLDAVHTWNDEFSINRLWETGAQPNFPRVRIDPLNGLPGFHALPEGTDNRDVPVGVPYREIPRASFRSGKTLVYSGWLEARNESDLDQLEADMTSAFASMDEGTMVLEQFSTGTKYLYTARCTALVIDGNAPSSRRRMTNGHERTFTLSLRMSDPRFYEYEELTESVTTVFLWGVSEVTVDAGSAPVEPVVTITAASPLDAVTLENVTTGRKLYLTDLVGGDVLTVDFQRRSIFNEDGDDVTDAFLIWDPSDWWDRGVEGLARGENVIRYNSSLNTMEVKWRKAHFG